MFTLRKRVPHFFHHVLHRWWHTEIRARRGEGWPAVRRRILRYTPGLSSLISLYRGCLRRVVFIGVTGSCGKTTTKELIAAVLSSRFQGRQSHGNGNLLPGIAKTILNVRPWDDFCVVEIAAAVGGNRIPLERPLRLVQPQIGVVTNIGTDHLKVFRTMEATAAEKGKLIAALPSHGTAILNADDAHVLAMHTRCAGQVVTYGLAPDAMVRAENIRSSWPERLSFTVLYDGQSRIVYTQLCGAHWVSCVLAAIAVGLAMGVPLDEAVRAIQTVPPFKRRMSPVSHSNGATFIQDDFKAPLWSIAPTLAFMKEARARRKIVVLGTISDYQGDPDRIYASVARQALDVADNVVFIGPHARKALRGRRHSQNETLRAFYCVEAAWDYLQDLWQPGDLVLLKDSDQEHLDTLLSERTSGDERPLSPHNHSGVFPMPTGEDTYATAVVGLGNPGKRSQSTPHNVGQRVLDRIAQSLGGEWTRQEQALVARIEWRGIPVYFVKPLTTVNATGLMLVRLIQQLGIGLTDCVLVHDDADLSLGTVRVRMRSSDGGHRGVRSVFKAFRTDDLRRVKVGVGRPAQQGQLDDHVMTAFSSVELPIIDQACAEAADRVLELVGGHSNRVRVTDG